MYWPSFGATMGLTAAYGPLDPGRFWSDACRPVGTPVAGRWAGSSAGVGLGSTPASTVRSLPERTLSFIRSPKP